MNSKKNSCRGNYMKKYGKLLRQFATVLCKLGSVNLFVLTVINLSALKRRLKKVWTFFQFHPTLALLFFQIYVFPQCIFMQLKAKGEALIKLV